MKFRLARDASIFPHLSRQFDSKAEAFIDWGYKPLDAGIKLIRPDGMIIIIPFSNMDWLEYEPNDIYGTEATDERIRSDDRDRDVSFVAVGNDEPERLAELRALIGTAQVSVNAPSVGVPNRPVKEESSDLHPPSGEDLRLPASRGRGRPRK